MTQTEEVHIGKLIKHQVSQRPDLTIRAFAERLGVHEQTVYDIYRRSDIHTDQLKRIAEILDLPITYFFFPDDLPPAEPETASARSQAREAEEREVLPEIRPLRNGSARPIADEAAALRRELDWMREKVELLEARLRDKEEVIALLRRAGK